MTIEVLTDDNAAGCSIYSAEPAAVATVYGNMTSDRRHAVAQNKTVGMAIQRTAGDAVAVGCSCMKLAAVGSVLVGRVHGRGHAVGREGPGAGCGTAAGE